MIDLTFPPFDGSMDLAPHIRQRLEGEMRMVGRIMEALARDGWTLAGVDLGDGAPERLPAGDLPGAQRQVMEGLCSVEEAQLLVRRQGEGGTSTKGWVYFLLGNSPEEVAADWTMNLSATLDPIVLDEPQAPEASTPRGVRPT